MNIQKISKKLILLFFLLLAIPISSFATVNSESWTINCTGEEKKKCSMMIVNQIKVNNEEKRTFATAYISIASSTQKTMNLVDKENQTYKLGEAKKNVPVIIVDLPLNVSLQKNPMIMVDGKAIGNLTFQYCNREVGCKTAIGISEQIINIFKNGKSLSVIVGRSGNTNKEIEIKFPLKGFTKTYKKLTKI